MAIKANYRSRFSKNTTFIGLQPAVGKTYSEAANRQRRFELAFIREAGKDSIRRT
jgi:hypothetical protein